MNKDLRLIGEAYRKQILLKEEYSYMYDKIPFDFKFPIVKRQRKDPTDSRYDREERYINREWKDIKEKIYLFYEAEYKRAKLANKSNLFDPFIDKLYTYFKNLYDSYMDIFNWEVEQGHAREMIDQDWYHVGRVDKPSKEDPSDPRTRKILAINSIINLIHRDTPMLTRYLKDGYDGSNKNKSWEEGSAAQLEAFLNTMSNDPGKFRRRWDKEIEKEFDVRIVNGQVLY